MENPSPAAPPRSGKRPGFLREIARNRYSYLLILPAMVYVFIFSYATYPYLLIAFQRFNYQQGLLGSEWVGFDNFVFFFRSNAALLVTWNTIKLNVLFLIFVTFFAVALALLFNEIRNKFFIKLAQTTMIFPSFLSWIIVSYMMYSLFTMDFGIINQVIQAFGGEPVNWYSKAEAWPAILVGMKVWKEAGMASIIYLAAITGIDGSLYESAEIDGASRWQKMTRITLPLIAPTIAILTLLNLGKIFYGDFGMIYAIIGDNGVLYPTTDVIDTYVFRALRQIGDPSNAAAVGLFQSTVGLLLVFGANWLTRRFFKEGALY
ncbi:sugar ABC transporter permease [Paenibacillus darwinianus]|uniref:Sugar ABC transporter permease n=1 Tax=Paenibacillus darwinianus TaxID=1380763 RepID=A0A9W5RZL0_9BACL|nr:ABC transporter permease subunit [Paenibacillus darwinianus]EXX85935.1 sugar ABC transporter permease [Paenibacillus darwinianus]EXX85996.1 sugar ABC transporter permease [Paenibacillus darwinianus]EXX86090.1 sugar ABC transporter permease [Paenibacillus darwinianus]